MSLSMWPALFAWGAGLIHIAVAAGSPPAVLVPVTALGVAELLWGIAALRIGRIPLVRTTLAVALSAAVVGLVLALFGLMAWVPLASSSVMLLAVAGSAGALMRRMARGTDAAASARSSVRAASPARVLIGVVAGALLVSALTTPALAQTKAGDYAIPHGEMTSQHGH